VARAHDVLAQAFGTENWTIGKPRDGRQKECYIASDGNRTVFVKFAVPVMSLQRLSEIGVAPRVLASGTYQGTSYVIQAFLASSYPDRPWIRSHVTQVADLIRTYHQDRPLADILAQREALSYRQHLDDDLGVLQRTVASQADASLRAPFEKLKELAQSFDDAALEPVHNEPNTKNMLLHDGKLTFIDWDEVLLSDPLRDIGVFLWWYLPIPQWQDFFRSYDAPFSPLAELKVYWFAARASLAICLFLLEHVIQMAHFMRTSSPLLTNGRTRMRGERTHTRSRWILGRGGAGQSCGSSARHRYRPFDCAYFLVALASQRSRRVERLSLAPFRRVQPHGLKNKCLQRRFINRVTVTEVNGPNGVAIQARIEELLGILHLSTLGEGQPHSALE
jgi:hypothetical protein